MCNGKEVAKALVLVLFASAILIDLSGRIELEKHYRYAKLEAGTCSKAKQRIPAPVLPDYEAFFMSERPLLHIGNRELTAIQLSRLSAGGGGGAKGFHWFTRKDGELCRRNHQHAAFDSAPSNVVNVAKRLKDALDGAAIPGGDTEQIGHIFVITSVGDFDAREACLLALGIQTRYWSLATLRPRDWSNNDDMPYGGFCYAKDEFEGLSQTDIDSDPNRRKIVPATKVMANELERGFKLYFSDEEVVCGPVLYGGFVHENIIGVLAVRVST